MTLLATAPEPVDAGHLLPADDWAAVVAGADARAAELGRLAMFEGDRLLFAIVDRTIAARSHGGAMSGGPRLGVLHSAETPLRAGYAYSIAANWFATKATTSATVMIDPAETIRLLPDDVVAYHCGPRANGFTVGVEQAGYAHLTLADWTTPEGRRQMRRVAEYLVDCFRRWALPLRWATDDEIRAAAAGGPRRGWCTHDDIRRVLGGTTHTDPGGNYPRAELMALAVAIANGADTPEDDLPLTPTDEALIKEHGSLAEAIARRVTANVATAENPWGLDALLKRLMSLQRALAAADANDAPQALAAAVAPLIADAVVEGVQAKIDGGGSIEGGEQLGAVVEAAVRNVFAELATPAAD